MGLLKVGVVRKSVFWSIRDILANSRVGKFFHISMYSMTRRGLAIF